MKQLRQTIMILVIAFLIGAGFVLHISNANYAKAQASSLAAAPAGSDTTARLNALKQYVSTHSGATVTVTLTTTYNQALQAAQAATAAAQAGSVNSSLYAAAQAACAGHAVSTVQAQCNQQYIETHSSPAAASISVPQPNLSAYTYHFAAPFLAFDLPTVLWGLAFVMIIVLALPVIRPQPYL